MNILWRFFPIYKYRVFGNSMSPTLKENDIVLVSRLSYLFHQPKLNDVIVLRDPRNNREVIKRITKVRNSTYFIEGDNHEESTDSRVYGEIKKTAIVGKVLLVL